MRQSPVDLQRLAATSVIALASSACAGDDTGSTAAPNSPSATEASIGDEVVTSGPDDGTVRVAVAVSAGAAAADDDRVDVPLGATVELTVTADVDNGVHVHGYELHGDVKPGSSAVITFTPDIPGVFEVEFEATGLLLVELEIG